MNNPDPIAIRRHHAFGQDQASIHFEKYPKATFAVADLLAIMRESTAPTAADFGFGSKAMEPMVRAAACGFLRRWRALQRGNATAGWVDWPPSTEK